MIKMVEMLEVVKISVVPAGLPDIRSDYSRIVAAAFPERKRARARCPSSSERERGMAREVPHFRVLVDRAQAEQQEEFSLKSLKSKAAVYTDASAAEAALVIRAARVVFMRIVL